MARATAIDIMDRQKPVRAINYDDLPDPKEAKCSNCYWGTPSRNGGGTFDCHFSGQAGAHPSQAQRPDNWWCNNHIPMRKKVAEVDDR